MKSVLIADTFPRRMRILFFVSLLGVLGSCAPTPHTVRYQGKSSAEQALFAQSDRSVYPDDVRRDVESFKNKKLAWTGIVKAVHEEHPSDPKLSLVAIEHHYWDWMEDHSIQKAKAFLSPLGEGEFICHVERTALPKTDLREAMAVAYLMPVTFANDELHCACQLQFFPPDWYLTDVFEYGRDGENLKILRIPMK